MKRITVLLSLIALCFTAKAQTSTNQPPVPTSPSNFFSQAGDWLSTANTGYGTFSTNLLTFDVGVADGQQILMRNDLEVNPFASIHNLGILATGDTLGQTTVINDGTAGIGYDIHVGDVRITPNINVGYDWGTKNVLGRAGANVAKGLTRFTYMKIGCNVAVEKKAYLEFTASTGFSF